MKIDFKIFGLLFLFYAITIFTDIQANKFKLVDFEVYYNSAIRIWNNIELYQHTEAGHYLYKYSPVFAMLMIPFGFLKFELAKWFFLAFIFSANYFIFYFLKRAYSFELKLSHILLLILIFSKHLNKEIILGQINIILLALIVVSIYYLDSKAKLSSLALMISLFIKPVGLILVLYYMITKRYRYIAQVLLFSLVLFSLSLFFVDINSYQNWILELKNELLAKTDFNSIDTQTIFAMMHRVLKFQDIFITIIGLAIWSLLIEVYYKIRTKHFLYILLSSIPLLACTSNNFYLLSIPLFFYLISKFSEFTIKLKLGFVIASILMCINQYELWGRVGVDLIDQYTPYCFSVLIALFVLINFEHKKRSELIHSLK